MPNNRESNVIKICGHTVQNTLFLSDVIITLEHVNLIQLSGYNYLSNVKIIKRIITIAYNLRRNELLCQ